MSGDAAEVVQTAQTSVSRRIPGFTRTSSTDTTAATELFKKRLQRSELDFMNITGDPGDVERDPEVACGDTSLTFEDVSFSVGDKTILQPVSGHFEPGSLVAVMGPSGSGKTTLLDILAGKKSSPHGGRVHFNGRPRDHLFARLSAYVAQDDILPAHLTVQEAVRFHHSLKQERPSKLTSEMCDRRLDKALEDLGLLGVKNEYIGDQSVRGISGGQRRRVSLACGFAHFPQIMFCDEPTSGLSATDAEACVKYMRLIAHKYGITILVVIHQPRVEVTKLFDELLLLTDGGRCVYNDSMRGVRAHCAAVGHPVPPHMNPTDHIMDKVTPGLTKSREVVFVEYYMANCKPRVDALVETHLYAEGRSSMELLQCQHRRLKEFGRLPPLRQVKYGVRFRRQLQLVGRRQITLLLRDNRGILADLFTAIAKGLILGLTYLDIGTKGASGQLPFFFMLMMSVSIDGMKGMPKQISERRVMKNETSEALYSEWAYIIPFSIISWVQAVMANTIFMLLIFSISSMPWPMFMPLWFWTTMLYVTMDSMFLMLSAIAKDASTAVVMSMPFFILFLLFNGFTVGRNSAPWYLVWLVEISPVAKAIEQSMMAAVRFYGAKDPMYEAVANFFAYRYEPGVAFSVMLGVTALFRIVQVASLKFLNNIQR
eukprot:CAMPEP_0170224222 /NCGR_PEP_ID=MMETSP0116_2-20130129/11813_1 /TAXON_ID=400756 /ORGANISM="Durinskia baltica, Strain CSIRO CS-38" /LENGTH=654 /DNA_ID=CAMNT_0010474929 /DNA_START=91 /DNA_END=2055 /DNA_ORIENTATION=-